MTSTAPTPGGNMFGFEEGGEALIDTNNAVLLDSVGLSLAMDPAELPFGAGVTFAMLLSGRINKTTAQGRVLYLMDVESAAVVAATLIEAASEAGGETAHKFLEGVYGATARLVAAKHRDRAGEGG